MAQTKRRMAGFTEEVPMNEGREVLRQIQELTDMLAKGRMQTAVEIAALHAGLRFLASALGDLAGGDPRIHDSLREAARSLAEESAAPPPQHQAGTDAEIDFLLAEEARERRDALLAELLRRATGADE